MFSEGNVKYMFSKCIRKWGGKEETEMQESGGQGEKSLYFSKKCLRALNSNDCFEWAAQRCEDAFAGMEFWFDTLYGISGD